MMKTKLNMIAFLAVCPFLFAGMLLARFKENKRIKIEKKDTIYTDRLIPKPLSNDTAFTAAMSILHYKEKFGHNLDEAGVAFATHCENALTELEIDNQNTVKIARKLHSDVVKAGQVIASLKTSGKPKKDLDIN